MSLGQKILSAIEQDTLTKKSVGPIKEKIEQKYEKSNPDYNRFLKDVRYYKGSYDYLFGGKVNAEYEGDPIRVDYFYYRRPYGETTYHLVTNVLTPYNTGGGDYIQDAIDKELERSTTQLSNKEIKDKILDIISNLK